MADDLDLNYQGAQNATDDGGEVVVEASPLSLPLEDDEILRLIDDNKRESRTRYNELKITDRRKKLDDFYLGKQQEEELQEHEMEHVDNIIYRDTEARIALASGRMPDIMAVSPNPEIQTEGATPPPAPGMPGMPPPPAAPTGGETATNDDTAKTITKTLEQKINTDAIQRIIKDGLRHHQLNFTAIVKCYWDKNQDSKNGGDFVFELLDPKKVTLDASATIPHDRFTSDNCQVIIEEIEEATALVLAKFPKKANELTALIGKGNKLPSKIKYEEVHFTFYDKTGKRSEGMAHRYKSLILDKSLTPYFDWEGVKANEITENNGITAPAVNFNYFQEPHKPYILFSYINRGTSPLDDTTAVEQAIPLQRLYNKRRAQITKIADNAVPKKVYAGSAMTRDQAGTITNDPNESLYLESATDLSKEFFIFAGPPPSPVLYNDMQDLRQEVDSLLNTHSISRGENVGHQSGIAKQVTREGDLTISDDIVDIVIVRVVQEMAQWALQMMRMFYKEERVIREMSTDGDVNTYKVSRAIINPDVSIIVKANTVDKAELAQTDSELAQSGNIDPYTLFEDMDLPNPRERAARVVAWKSGEETGFAQYRAMIKDPSLQPVTTAQPVPPPAPAGMPGMPPESGAALPGLPVPPPQPVPTQF